MIAFVLGLLILFAYFVIKSDKTKRNPVDVLGLVGILFIIWGVSRYQGVSSKPLWDPN
jgi:hypothetical protein